MVDGWVEAGVNTRIAGWWLVAGWLAGYVIVYWLGIEGRFGTI